mmetsp:Transcript_8018/g.22047  ORF Transcript_8018/g.22047 Transcript_8018/m.22047 type:complete len:435 (+) Transcript_8018:50-1354(+)
MSLRERIRCMPAAPCPPGRPRAAVIAPTAAGPARRGHRARGGRYAPGRLAARHRRRAMPRVLMREHHASHGGRRGAHGAACRRGRRSHVTLTSPTVHLGDGVAGFKGGAEEARRLGCLPRGLAVPRAPVELVGAHVLLGRAEGLHPSVHDVCAYDVLHLPWCNRISVMEDAVIEDKCRPAPWPHHGSHGFLGGHETPLAVASGRLALLPLEQARGAAGLARAEVDNDREERPRVEVHLRLAIDMGRKVTARQVASKEKVRIQSHGLPRALQVALEARGVRHNVHHLVHEVCHARPERACKSWLVRLERVGGPKQVSGARRRRVSPEREATFVRGYRLGSAHERGALGRREEAVHDAAVTATASTIDDSLALWRCGCCAPPEGVEEGSRGGSALGDDIVHARRLGIHATPRTPTASGHRPLRETVREQEHGGLNV